MLLEEYVYSKHDNIIALTLSIDGIPIDHIGIAQVELYVGAELISSIDHPTYFDTSNSDKLIIKLSDAGIIPGRYKTRLIIYDLNNPDGLVWGDIMLVVH